MPGQHQPRPTPSPLGQQLRELREKAQVPGRTIAAAAEIDSAVLSKIENGKRLPTAPQLAAMAQYFKVALAPLEARRVAEDMKRRYGGHANFAEVTSILREEAGEYRVKKVPAAVSKSGQPVNKRRKVP